MQHIYNLNQFELSACQLTIGSFDGVHLGHQSLISSMTRIAHEKNQPSVVLTFYPHPSVVLRGRRPSFYIHTPDEKAGKLAELGVDYVITHPFDHDLSRLSAIDFLDLLKKHTSLKGLWVGENFALGHKREGNLDFLENVQASYGFALKIVPPVLLDGEIVSSTRIRNALRTGDVKGARAALGRPFMMPGPIVRGAERGRELGFPTANLAVWDERAYPAPGVYACRAIFMGQSWDTVTNIGVRPTFGEDLLEPIVEAHLLNFDGNLYDEIIQLAFYERLRDERKFPDKNALIRQINLDIEDALVILKTIPEELHV
jgi:riboflavin kinase / FMN adenylyltransferase